MILEFFFWRNDQIKTSVGSTLRTNFFPPRDKSIQAMNFVYKHFLYKAKKTMSYEMVDIVG